MSAITAGIAKVVAAMVQGKAALDSDTAKQIAAALAKNFKVTTEEVAILRLAGKQLEFVVPEKLAQVGTIPMSSTNALAVRTTRDGKAEFSNNFTGSVHPTVFEGVRLKKGETSEPIQKIISVPILVNGKGSGAIQVSRKGKTAAAAGADFSSKDVDELSQVATALAGCFQAS